MNYFSKGYDSLRLPIAEGKKVGLRRAQIGALHSIGAHYSLPRTEPTIIVMPTGSGKTAVMLAAAFLLRAKRVLILTPSQLVRAQITEEAKSLDVLKNASVLPAMMVGPNVIEVKSRLGTAEEWKALETAEFVVSTPQCVSPGIEGVAEPLEGIFDLIFMDEAHHSEATRWADILRHFKNTKRLLFTATPFRRDKKELKGTIIFNYPLRHAHEDKIFGDLIFVPVAPAAGEDHDVAIAKAAARIYEEDKAEGLTHRLMVRTDSKKKADELEVIYKDNTALSLAVVHSGHALSTIKKVLERLRAGELDGIICVAMMGEGFDFPQLKIAAIHSPHKSLAVTLQFIGRFARTSGQRIGKAKFLAVPQDIEAETDELYRESAAWQEIVSNLSAAKIEREVKIKMIASSFEPLLSADADIADVVLTDCRPYFHVKIYRIDDAPDLERMPRFDGDVNVLRHEVSEEHTSALILLKQTTQPRWTDLERFSRTEYDFIVVYYDEAARLLFINSTKRTIQLYKLFEDLYGNGTARLLTGPRINRVLADLKNTEFFNVGLKNTVQTSNTESYQIKSGPNAQNAISPTDGLLYQRGHLFGKGSKEDGSEITIGYSSSSKVWSNYSARVGELVEWCKELAKKLNTKGAVVTGTPLDSLQIGEEVSSLPEGLLSVDWSANVYKDFPRIRINASDDDFECQLLDFDLSLNHSGINDKIWEVILTHDRIGEPLVAAFSIEDDVPRMEWVQEPPVEVSVMRERENIGLIDYLNHYPLVFFLDDFSRVEGATLHKNQRQIAFDVQDAVAYDWTGKGVDIQKEYGETGLDVAAASTIQDFLAARLLESAADFVFFDHGTGEIADFVTFTSLDSNRVEVGLYHCKGSGGKADGDRVGDAYEVCGQVVKCLIWLKRDVLRKRVAERELSPKGNSQFLRGNRNDFLRLLADERTLKLEVVIHLVQPGISISSISEKIAFLLGASSDYVRRASGAKMKLIGSP